MDPDDYLGEACVTVTDLLLSPHRRKELPLTVDGRETGAFITLSCAIGEWTSDLKSLEPEEIVLEESKNHMEEEVSGMLVIIINRAFDLPLDRQTAATFVRAKFAGVEYDSNIVYDYPGYYDALNPIYDSAFTIPITSTMNLSDDQAIELELIDTGGDSKSKIILDSMAVTLGDLKRQPDHTLTERRKFSNINGASIEFRISLSGVTIQKHQPTSAKEIDDVAKGYAPGSSSPVRALPSPRNVANGHVVKKQLDYDEESLPIGHLGTVRITVVKGRGLRIEQQLFEVAIPDCYCIVKFGPDDFRTTTKYNTCSPTWEEHKDFPLQDHGQLVTLEVWDMNEEVIGNGIPLGSTKTTVGKLLMSGGSMELEVLKEGRSSGIHIALRCDMVA